MIFLKMVDVKKVEYFQLANNANKRIANFRETIPLMIYRNL
jgi:hypothetical protein